MEALKNNTLWSYWEGPTTPVIDLCIESLRLHNSTFNLVTPESFAEMGGQKDLEFLKGLPPPQRSDLIRLWLLREYGGIWTDLDCIALRPLDLMKEIHRWQLFGIYNPYQRKGYGQQLLSTPFGGKMGSPLISRLYDICYKQLQQMKSGIHIPYGSTSVGILSQLWKTQKRLGNDQITRWPHWRYNRVPWAKARQVYLQKGNPHQHEWYNAWNPNAYIYHLTNVITDYFKNHTRHEILLGHAAPPGNLSEITPRQRLFSFTGFLFNKALELPRYGLIGRAWEICQRIPKDTPTVGAEIGVFRASNARNILQAREHTRLKLVDPYASADDNTDYRKTGDSQAFFGQERWDRFKIKAAEALAFAGDKRAIWVYHTSKVAASHTDDNSLDYVFIDANHSKPGCATNIAEWFSKVKPGGWIGGHDYSKAYPGVVAAVDEFFKDYVNSVELGIDVTWFVKKKEA